VEKENALMKCALAFAELSTAKRSKVGCVIAKDRRIVSSGYNGTLPGSSNECEVDDVTRPDVLHAEENALTFAAKNGLAVEGCSVYLTLSPCISCAKLMIAAGITEVIYMEQYRKTDGIDLLIANGVLCEGIHDRESRMQICES
jgi:dCMP deaminase